LHGFFFFGRGLRNPSILVLHSSRIQARAIVRDWTFGAPGAVDKPPRGLVPQQSPKLIGGRGDGPFEFFNLNPRKDKFYILAIRVDESNTNRLFRRIGERSYGDFVFHN